jgi:hypothetical protein
MSGPGPIDKTAERKAALAYEREQNRRDRERAKGETAEQKERERRQQAVDKAQAALDKAGRDHADRAAAHDEGSRSVTTLGLEGPSFRSRESPQPPLSRSMIRRKRHD